MTSPDSLHSKAPLPHVDGNVPPTLFTKNAGDSSSVSPDPSSLESSMAKSDGCAANVDENKSKSASSHCSSLESSTDKIADGTSALSSLEASTADSDKSTRSRSSSGSNKSYMFQYTKQENPAISIPKDVRKTNHSAVDHDSVEPDENLSLGSLSGGATPVNELSSNDVTLSAQTVLHAPAVIVNDSRSNTDDITREDDNPTPVAGSNATPRPAAAEQASGMAHGDEHRETIQSKDRKTTITTYTWEMPRKKLYNGIWTQEKPLAMRKSIEFTIPISCKKRNDPKIFLRVVPCENEQSRHISIEGEFVIKRKCSRYKWLVEYCRCSIVLAVKVINPLNNNELCSTEREFEIQYSDLNRDHRTSLKLTNVLDHDCVIYNRSITTFHFHATLKLLEHQVRRCMTTQNQVYECKEGEESTGFIEIVPRSS